jgi:hypothetical protein
MLNGMQERSLEYLSRVCPQIAQVISITQDTTTETFSHQRWGCYDVRSEAAARILKSDASQGVGFHPRMVLFVLDLEGTIHGEIPPQRVSEARDVRFEEEESHIRHSWHTPHTDKRRDSICEASCASQKGIITVVAYGRLPYLGSLFCLGMDLQPCERQHGGYVESWELARRPSR